MKIFVYEADEIVPIEGLYEWLGDSGRIIFSNADQAIQHFDSREVLRLLGSINFDTVIFYIPSQIQDQFVELVNQQITNQWEEDNNVNLSIGDIGLIGNDELSQFFEKMVLERVVKPKGYETSEPKEGVKEGVRFEKTVDAYLNAIENFGDKIAKAIESKTQNKPQIMWKDFLTLSVGVVVIIAVIFWLYRMTTQPPFNEFHELKNENAQFQITIEQKEELLKQKENDLQELTNANDENKRKNLILQMKINIAQKAITRIRKKVSPEIDNLLSRLKPSSWFVVIATYKSEQNAQNQVNKIETLYAELGAGKFQDGTTQKWLVFIGKSYTLDSAKELKEYYIKVQGITKNNQMPYLHEKQK
jgi:hypothetical protein